MTGRLRPIRKGQIILYQGEAALQIHHLQDGLVRAYSILPGGNEVNIALFGPGDFFPAEIMHDAAPATLFYYEAMTDCQANLLGPADFAALQAADPRAAADFAKRYVGALLHINALGQSSAYHKLGHTLRYLAMRFGQKLTGPGFVRIVPRLTQQDLANLCGISRETASVELGKLKASGAVTEKAKQYSVHMPSLNALMGDNITTADVR